MRVFFETAEQLVSGDTDSSYDIYERSGGTTTLVSQGQINGNGAFAASFLSASSDGSRVVFETTERLASGDTDSSSDIYERSAGTTTQVSKGEINGNGAFVADFYRASNDGSTVFFETDEQLASADTDSATDVYESSGGTTSWSRSRRCHPRRRSPPAPRERSMIPPRPSPSPPRSRVRASSASSTPAADTAPCGSPKTYSALNDGSYTLYVRAKDPAGNVDPTPASRSFTVQAVTNAAVYYLGASSDGSRVFFLTDQRLVSSDTDSKYDVYQRFGGRTTLVSQGQINGNGAFDAYFAGASADGSKVFFSTQESLVSSDTDSKYDVYQRLGGATTLVSRGQINGNGAFHASFAGASSDGSRVFFHTYERLVSADTDSSYDLYQRSAGTTTLASQGQINGNGALDAIFEAPRATARGSSSRPTSSWWRRHR